VLVALVVGLLAAGFALVEWLRWRPGVTEANVGHIQPGMTLEEVETIFGGPPRARLDGGIMTWRGEAGVAFVAFDERGRVIGAALHPCQSSPKRPRRQRPAHGYRGW
jgi:hypothetical protein